MKHFRISLMTLALGLAAVYIWNGMSIAMNTIPVDLPKVNSDEVLVIFPSSYRDASFFYIPKEGEIENGRDLSLYDIGGFSQPCVMEDDWTKCVAVRSSARQFVNNHWKEKRRGYIEIGYPCTDCFPSDHIFIEPKENGDWHIAITRETNGGLFPKEAVNVKVRRANKDEEWSSSSKTVISFLDDNGHEIDYF